MSERLLRGEPFAVIARFRRRFSATCFAVLAAALLTGCEGDDDDRADLLAEGAPDAEAAAALTGLWEGTSIWVGGGGLNVGLAQILIRDDGAVDSVFASFLLYVDGAQELVNDRLISYQAFSAQNDDDARRRLVLLVNEGGTHALGITLDGRPLILQRGGLAESAPQNAIVGEWSGEGVRLSQHGLRVVGRAHEVGLRINEQREARLDAPSCAGHRLPAFELVEDKYSGLNAWWVDGLIERGDGGSCPSERDGLTFSRISITPDRQSLLLSVCDASDSAVGGDCWLYLLNRD